MYKRQALYEKHKVLTYPRTDSRHLPHDMRPKVQKVFQSLPEPYREWVPAPECAADPGKRVFDDAKITDHHAIVPTGRAPGSLTENERRIFDLVVRQLLAAFYPPMVSETVTVLTVSYTHLDVYKRQGRDVLLWLLQFPERPNPIGAV